jgi:crotonobetainyl-CoA:carnitine CoA-transferase CaiB-like acyl-CoA transferase
VALENEGSNPSTHPTINAPIANEYRTKDGRWIRLSMFFPDACWYAFCQAIDQEGLEKDLRFNSLQNRAENNVALIKVIDEAFTKRTAQER